MFSVRMQILNLILLAKIQQDLFLLRRTQCFIESEQMERLRKLKDHYDIDVIILIIILEHEHWIFLYKVLHEDILVINWGWSFLVIL